MLSGWGPFPASPQRVRQVQRNLMRLACSRAPLTSLDRSFTPNRIAGAWLYTMGEGLFDLSAAGGGTTTIEIKEWWAAGVCVPGVGTGWWERGAAAEVVRPGEGEGVTPEVRGGQAEGDGGRVDEAAEGRGCLADPMRGVSALGHDRGRGGNSDESGHAEVATSRGHVVRDDERDSRRSETPMVGQLATSPPVVLNEAVEHPDGGAAGDSTNGAGVVTAG